MEFFEVEWKKRLYFSWKPPETNCATICLITATISLNIIIHLREINDYIPNIQPF